MSSENSMQQIIFLEEPTTTFVDTNGVAQIGHRLTVAEVELGIGGKPTGLRYRTDICVGIIFARRRPG